MKCTIDIWYDLKKIMRKFMILIFFILLNATGSH